MVQASGGNAAGLEEQVNALNERSGGFQSTADYSVVQGSAMLTSCGQASLGSLTQWRVVLPLEFKTHVLTMTKLERDKKQASDDSADGMVVD